MDAGSEYYTSLAPRLVERFERDAQDWRQVMADTYDAEFIDTVIDQGRAEFERLILLIPFIGGDENPLTSSLIRSVRCLALYKAMRAYGRAAAETGKILYDAALLQAARPALPIPPDQWLSAKQLMQRRREGAARSQEQRYPGDYVYTFVEGDGETFDYGYNFTECASLTFFRDQGAAEFMPFFCFLDFPLAQAAHLGLSRTMTLAEGYPLCNHRFQRGGATACTWPPSFLTTG